MNEVLPFSETATIEEQSEIGRSRRYRSLSSTALGQARLDFEWLVTYTHPGTLTEAEAKRLFLEVLGASARAQCHLIITTLPDEIVPTLLPQLRDMAEYELRMWQVRKEVEGPDIVEQWYSLPATTV